MDKYFEFKDGVLNILKCDEEFSFRDFYNEYVYRAGIRYDDIKEINLPEGVKCLNERCFCYMRYLIKVNLPKSLQIIGEEAFSGCSSLKDIGFCEGLKVIKNDAFSNSGLVNVVLPKGLKYMGNKVFDKCGKLKRVEIGEGLTYIEKEAFFQSSVEEVVLPNSISHIFSHAFSMCNKLKKITLPNKLLSIGNNVFTGCKDLNEIDLPNSVERIGEFAFQGTGLQTLKLPSSLKKISAHTFNCSKIQEIILPEGLEKIDECAFYFSGLRKIYIPDSVTHIGEGAFMSSCLEEVRLPNKLKKISNQLFVCCKNLETIDIPEGVEEIEYSFSSCYKLKEVKFPKSLKRIADKAFCNCISLKDISLSSNVEVGKDAFQGCFFDKIDFIDYDGEFTNASDYVLKYSDGKIVFYDCLQTYFFFEKGKKISFDKDALFAKMNTNNEIFNLLNKEMSYVNLYKWNKKRKFMPHYIIIENMPSKDIDMFYKNGNCDKWADILSYASVKDNENRVALFKLCYVLGVFQDNSSKRDQVVEYIKNNILDKMVEGELSRRFSKFNLKNGFDSMYADFFIRYYSPFMSLRKGFKDNDFITSAYNNFNEVKKMYPNKIVNTNRNADVLLPEHVMSVLGSIKYKDVDDDNKELAKYAGIYGYNQSQYTRLQEWFNIGKNLTKENLKLFISDDIIKDKDEITYELLRKDNVLGAFVGDITNCCQKVGGKGESCVEYGIVQPNSKFMIFNYNDSIIGQAWVWYDEDSGVVCLDNIEIPKRYSEYLKDNDICDSFAKCLVRMANSFISEMKSNGLNVSAVTVGEGHNDLVDVLNEQFEKVDNVQKLNLYDKYSDAYNCQFLIKKK